MAHNKLRRNEIKDKIAKLTRLKDDLELNLGYLGNKHSASVEEIKAWKEYCNLSYKEQTERKRAWSDYYENVKETPIYALFQEQKKAMASGNILRVKDLAKQARLMRINGDTETLTKPKFMDPDEFDRGWVKAYRDYDWMIKQLNLDLSDEGNSNEIKEVWDE